MKKLISALFLCILLGGAALAAEEPVHIKYQDETQMYFVQTEEAEDQSSGWYVSLIRQDTTSQAQTVVDRYYYTGLQDLFGTIQAHGNDLFYIKDYHLWRHAIGSDSTTDMGLISSNTFLLEGDWVYTQLVEQREGNFHTAIYRTSLTTGEKTFLKEIYAYVYEWTVADGALYFTANMGNEYHSLYRLNGQTGDLTTLFPLTKLLRRHYTEQVQSFFYAADSKTVYFETRDALYQFSTASPTKVYAVRRKSDDYRTQKSGEQFHFLCASGDWVYFIDTKVYYEAYGEIRIGYRYTYIPYLVRAHRSGMHYEELHEESITVLSYEPDGITYLVEGEQYRFSYETTSSQKISQ